MLTQRSHLIAPAQGFYPEAVLVSLTSGSQLTLRYVLRLDQPVGGYGASTYEWVVELIADDRIGRRRVVK